jgi:hypothetical protein
MEKAPKTHALNDVLIIVGNLHRFYLKKLYLRSHQIIWNNIN